MKQINLQNKIREKFIKSGVKMIAPDTVFFSKIVPGLNLAKGPTTEPLSILTPSK